MSARIGAGVIEAVSLITLHVRISGRVQGVWYRGWTTEEAAARYLDGWVRNCRDGTVEAVFSGPQDPVRDMIEACRTGPAMARVDDIRITPAEPDQITKGQGFVMRETC